jgi:hypothetical protein
VPAPAALLALIAGIAMLTPAMLVRPLFLGLYAVTVVGAGALSVHLNRTATP